MRVTTTSEWTIQLTWWLSGIFGTGAVWYFLSVEYYLLAAVCAVVAIVAAGYAVVLHRKKDQYAADEAITISKARSNLLAENPTRENIIDTIMRSNPVRDWDKRYGSNNSIRTYKKDVNLRFEMLHGENDYQCRDFREPWANKFPDESAAGYWCDLYYASTLIERFILVSVDGGRALLPIPKVSREGGRPNTVLAIDYKVAQIHDTLRSLDQYLRGAGLEVQNAT